MKTRYIYIGLIAASTLFASCNKYLDIKPVGAVIPTSTEDFRALMVSAYNTFPAHKSYMSLRTDELVLDEWSEDLPYIKDIYLWNDLNPDPATTPYAYQEFYRSIFYANHVLTEIDAQAGLSDVNNQIKGEALALRAYAHFELLNMYAPKFDAASAQTTKGVAISTTIDLEQKFVPATIAEVFTQIFKDLDEAETLLVENTPTANHLRYRFSKSALYALKSRIHLYRGEWSLSKDFADQALAINNHLEDLNLTDSKLPNDFSSVEMIQALEDVGRSTVSRSTYIHPDFVAKYNNGGDLRRTKYFRQNGSRWTSLKGGNNQFKSSFRNGELYLNIAESLAQQNHLEEAKDALLVLAAARLTPAYFTTYESFVNGLDDKELLLTEIYEERARELSLEGLRWYDLKRTTRASITHNFDGTSYVLQQGDARYVIRFPKQALENNPNL